MLKYFFEAIHQTPSRLEMCKINWHVSRYNSGKTTRSTCIRETKDILHELKAKYNIDVEDAKITNFDYLTFTKITIEIKLPKDKIQEIQTYLTSFFNDRPVEIDLWYE